MPQSAPPVTEKGYVNPFPGDVWGWSQQGDVVEQIPDLMWPRSVQTFGLMPRDDTRIASMLQAVGLPIRRTAWRIDPAGADDAVVEHIANDLGLPIVGDTGQRKPRRTKGRFSWGQHLQQSLTYLQYGHSVFEQVYDREALKSDGRAHLLKLAPRPQSTIARWNVARDGGLVSIEQWPAAGVLAPIGLGGTRIPVDRLVVYARDPDPGVWWGNSILRPAYKNWRIKDELMRIEAAAARRHGIGVPVMWAPPEDSGDPEKIAEYQETASRYTGGSSAGLGLPAEAKAAILSPSGTPMDPRRAVEYHDHQMALVALAHFLNLDGKGGSYALASVQQDAFVQALGAVADHIRETAQSHIVEDIVDLNWGPGEPAPRLVYDEIGSRQDATAAALQMLVNAGLLTPDARLESFIRTASGLPAVDPDTEPAVPPANPAPEVP